MTNEKSHLDKLEALKKAYKEYNAKAVAEAQAATTESAAGVVPHIVSSFEIPGSKWLTENVIRFIPPKSDDTSGNLTVFYLKANMHWINGRTVLGSDTFGGPQCPLMAAFFSAHHAKDDARKKYFQAGSKYFAFVENYTAVKKGNPPKLELAAIPKLLWGEIILRAKDRRTGALLDFLHPIKGRQIGFSKSGEGVGTKYGNVEIYGDDSPLQELYNLPRFDEILQPVSREQAEEIVAGYVPPTRKADDPEPAVI